LGGVSPLRAGLGWNGVYILAAGAALTLWALSLFYILWPERVTLHAATTFNHLKRGYNLDFDLPLGQRNQGFLDLDELSGIIKPWAMSELMHSFSSELVASGLVKAFAPAAPLAMMNTSASGRAFFRLAALRWFATQLCK
jgi:hypothetical protein